MLYHLIYASPLRQIVWAILMLPILCGSVLTHKRRISDVCLTCVSLLLIVYLTLLNREGGSREFSLLPLHSFVLARQQPELYRSMLMNVFLFVPLGLFLPFVFRSKNILKSVITAFLVSAFVEIMQYIFGLGLAEVDDLLTNTLGAFIGSMSFLIYRKLNEAD